MIVFCVATKVYAPLQIGTFILRTISILKHQNSLQLGVQSGTTIRIMEAILIVYQNLGIKNSVTNSKASCKSSPLSMEKEEAQAKIFQFNLRFYFWRRGRDSFSPEGSVRVGSDLPPAGHSLPTRSNPYNKETEPYTRYGSTSLAERKGFEPLWGCPQTVFKKLHTRPD